MATPRKVTLKHAATDVDAAGQTLVKSSQDEQEVEKALSIVNNWRAAHGFPLNTLKLNLQRNSLAIDAKATVAQRIKRLPAIIHKLERYNKLPLSEYQDVGGCRAVLANVKQVRFLRARYEKTSNLRHQLLKEDDYIAAPKKSGYRSIHLVWSYVSDRNNSHNGRKIEMQLRSRSQHAWATTVETAGMFTGEYFKSSQGDPQWLRFFALMSSAMAMREGEPCVPNTPTEQATLRNELKAIARALDARERLIAYGRALEFVEPTKGYYFILKLIPRASPGSSVLEITPFSKKDRDKATRAYAQLELSLLNKQGTEVVLVSVNDAKSLRAAYPNYYLDTQMFVKALEAEIK